jgi:DNA-binding NarL/FixJ family response regulator
MAPILSGNGASGKPGAVHSISVLIVSGFLDDVPLAQRSAVNVAGYLSKPLALTDLISAVRADARPSVREG